LRERTREREKKREREREREREGESDWESDWERKRVLLTKLISTAIDISNDKLQLAA
jgi:hypothetical protein